MTFIQFMEALVPHDILAGNPLLGSAFFLQLPLPPAWHLAPGVSRPEVVAVHRRRDKPWIVTGDGWYVVYHEERGWALEFHIHVRPPRRNRNHHGEQTIPVNGHTATVHWKTRRRGLPWHRHDVTFMTVAFHCPHSERDLELEFSGWCPQQGFDEVLHALQALRCH